jgi:hypothetical protein
MRNLHGSPYGPRPTTSQIERGGGRRIERARTLTRRSGESLASIGGLLAGAGIFAIGIGLRLGKFGGNRSLGSNLYGGTGGTGGGDSDTSRLTPTKSDANGRPSRRPAAPPRSLSNYLDALALLLQQFAGQASCVRDGLLRPACMYQLLIRIRRLRLQPTM